MSLCLPDTHTHTHTHTHTPEALFYLLFTESVFSLFTIRLFHLLECSPPHLLAGKSKLILQCPDEIQYLLWCPLSPTLLWLMFSTMLSSTVLNFLYNKVLSCIKMTYGYLFLPPDVNSWEAVIISYPSLYPVVILTIINKHTLEFLPVLDTWAWSWDPQMHYVLIPQLLLDGWEIWGWEGGGLKERLW